MTLEECKQATTLLAFAEEMSELHNTAEEAFFAALTRAIWQTEGVRPRTASLLLHHTSPFTSSMEVGADGYVRYALDRLASDFSSLAEPPLYLTEEGYISLRGGYLWEGGCVLSLPREKEGYYRILYRRKPQGFTPEMPLDTVIDLDEELCQLLPLLVAHYLLLDEEPEKAAQYLTLYREQYALIRNRCVTNSGADYYSVNGW